MQAKLWVLLGRKAGDNAQVLALAETTGLPFEEKQISARSWEIVPHLLLGPTLAGIDRSASSPLAPPWPDLVISAGRRNEPVARWIRAQARGAVRLVHIGRPWARPATWDLIVTTPQYFLPEADNVLQIPLPLRRITRDGVDVAARQIAPRLAHLPRPLTAVLIGGDSGPFVFTPDKGRRLAEGVNRLVAQSGGTALVTDSPRTPKAATEAFRKTINVPAESYWWHDPHTTGDNPYQGFLGLADRFVVTGESMSMMAEAASLGRPLYLFDPGDPPGTWWRHPHNFRHKPLSHALAMRLAPRRMRRDVSRLQDALMREGRASWLDDAPRLIAEGENWATEARSDPTEDVQRAAARVLALLKGDTRR
ncbi:mitochondrial fission ELM1 family protein [Roseovarius sp. D22-M7]|uniref:mitochondrial fission ELM1 family protein n=1 Tax=Roseovarius sp. D22-M7 TaxID=3127116 RepID=UPI00300FCCDA